MMVFWFIIIGILLYFLLAGNQNFNVTSKKAENTLNERLAKGEISIDEYREIKKTLEENRK